MRSLILRCILLAGLYALATTPFAGFNQANEKNAASPALIYSTYLGGAERENGKASSDMKASAIAADAEGNVYVTGNTASNDFPGNIRIGNAGSGSTDLFVAKYSPEGALVYSTRVGGSGLERGFGIAVDSTGNAYVTGRTQSTDFPIVNAAQPRFGGKEDAFVFKLNPAGTALVYSTYLGGSGTDFACGIAVDSAGNAYVTGDSESADFPVTLGAAQRQFRGGVSDGFAAKLNASGSALLYASYLGGTGFDHGESIVAGKDGTAYVTGYTSSPDFPTVKPVQPGFAGIVDAFLAKLNESGSALVYSTYLGGAAVDGGTSVSVDSAGNAFVAGTTASADFPVTKGALQSSFGGSQDAFVTMLNPEGTALTYSTFVGGANLDGAYGIAGDPEGRIYITGATRSPEFPVSNAFQPKHAGNDEVFVTTLSSSGGLLFSSFLGGTGWDLGDGIAVDRLGNVYLTGRTNSSDFPTVKAAQPGYGGNGDAFVAKISPLSSGVAFTSVSAASYAKDGPLAPESIASGFGANLAAGLAQAQGLTLPETLGGITVKIRDSAGTERAAPLFFVSPNQINYFVTTGTRTGPAAVSVWNQEKLVAAGTVQIESVAPGLFSKNGDGRGVPAALALKVAADGTQTVSPVFQCGGEPGSCVTAPVDLGSPTDQVILLLFGTGIRGRSALDAVKVRIGGVDAEVLYAGAQNEFPGLDQLNVRLPRSLAGRGKVDVTLAVDGKGANTLELYIR